MASADYQLCRECGCKITYDPYGDDLGLRCAECDAADQTAVVTATLKAQFLSDVKMALANINGDAEDCHTDTDKLMENLLIKLGFGDGVALIQKSERWYA